MNDITTTILKSINSVIAGKEAVVEKVLMAILSGGHVLLEDVPGVGKTTLAVSFARTLGLDTRRVQFTSDTMPSDILGFSVYNRDTGNFDYKPGAVMTNLLLADEINRTSSKTQSALLEAMEEYHVTVDGQTYPLPEPFVVLATQNPVGSAGTQLLPAAQLDRFLIRTSMGYPDAKSQIDILKERHHENPLDKLTAAVSREQLLSLMNDARQVHISDPVYAYVVDLVTATRENEFIELGVSPRGALALSAPPKRGGESAVTLEDPLCGLYRLSVEKARVYRQPAHRCGAAAGDFHRRQDMDGGQSDYHRQDRHCQVERPQNRCTVPCDGDQGPSRLHAADRAAVHRDAGQR